MNFAQIIAAVGNRAAISSQDPWYSRLADECVMPAIHEIETFNQAGWDWLWRDVSFTMATSSTGVSFDDLADEVADNADGTVYPITRVHAVSVDPAALGYYCPIARLNRHDLDGYNDPYGISTVGWTAEGQRLIWAPTPTADLAARARVLIAEKELGGSDALLMPTRYHNTVIDLARAYVFEMKADDARAAAARTRAEATLRRAMNHSRPWGGSGSTPLGN